MTTHTDPGIEYLNTNGRMRGINEAYISLARHRGVPVETVIRLVQENRSLNEARRSVSSRPIAQCRN
jgi:hypothetical protein